jgi:hypothetical protein
MGSFADKFLFLRYIKNNKLQSITERVSPTLAKIDKPQRGGQAIVEPFIPSGPQGWSYDLAAASVVSDQADRGASDYETWTSPFGEYWGSAKVSARAVSGSKGNEDAFLQQLTETMDGALKSFGSIAAIKLFAPVGNNLGRISDLDEGGGAGEIQLTIRGDSFNYAPGMILQAATGTGASTPGTVRAGLGYVFRVTPDADVTGTTTTGAHIWVATSAGSTTSGGPSGWADNDYLFRNGDVLTGTDLSDKQIRSLQGWVTLTAATGNYLGVDRGVHAGASGFRVAAADVAGLSIKERCELLVNVGRSEYGASEVDTIVMGPRTWMQLSQEIQDFGWTQFGKVMEIGAGELVIITANGAIRVINEPHCKEADIWAFTIGLIKIYNYNGFPGPRDEDGLKMLRTGKNYEVQWQAFNSVTVGGQPQMHGRCSSGN